MPTKTAQQRSIRTRATPSVHARFKTPRAMLSLHTHTCATPRTDATITSGMHASDAQRAHLTLQHPACYLPCTRVCGTHSPTHPRAIPTRTRGAADGRVCKRSPAPFSWPRPLGGPAPRPAARAAARPAPCPGAGRDGPGLAGAVGRSGGRQRGVVRGAEAGGPGPAPTRSREEPTRTGLALEEPPRFLRTFRARRAVGPIQVPGLDGGSGGDAVGSPGAALPQPGRAKYRPLPPPPPRAPWRDWGLRAVPPQQRSASPRFPPRSLWQSPELLSDIQDGYSVSGHLLVCFSSGEHSPPPPPGTALPAGTPSPFFSPFSLPLFSYIAGYFIHDSLDIIFNQQSCSSWEYLVHHAMVSAAVGEVTCHSRAQPAGSPAHASPCLPGGLCRQQAGWLPVPGDSQAARAELPQHHRSWGKQLVGSAWVL